MLYNCYITECNSYITCYITVTVICYKTVIYNWLYNCYMMSYNNNITAI